jgi:hypothetical protein
MTDPTPTDWRALCAELFAIVEDEYSGTSCLAELRNRTVAALAQPEPQSLKESALNALEHILRHSQTDHGASTIRRALEALPND